MRRLLRRFSSAAAIMAALAVLSLLSAFVVVPMQVEAISPYGTACSGGGGGNSAVCQGQNNGADPIAGQNGAIVSITTLLAVVTGIISVIFIVIGGLKYVTSDGDTGGVSSAKSTIIAALIGLVIASLARPIVSFVVGKL